MAAISHYDKNDLVDKKSSDHHVSFAVVYDFLKLSMHQWASFNTSF